MRFNCNPSVGGSKNFLKVEEGKPVIGVFRGDVFEFYQKWDDGKSVITDSDDPEGKFRFRINFITKENGQLVSKIFENGAMAYNSLKELHEEYDLEKTFVKIIRTGQKLNTVYTFLPMKKEIDTNTNAQLMAVDLQELSPDGKGQVSSNVDLGAVPDFDSDEEIPF